MSLFARLFGIAPTRQPLSPFAAGVAALEAGRIDAALAHFATASASAVTPSERALIHNKLGIIHLQRGDRPAAIDALVEALAVDERCVPAIVNVGNLLLEDGMIDEAIVHYEAALRIDDDHAGAHLNLGIAFKRLGRRAAAVREFRRADRAQTRLRRRRGQ